MKEFNAGQRTDYLNRVVSNDQQNAMQKHPGTGCKSCAETVALRQKVADAGAAEANYQLAEEDVRVGKALFVTAGMAAKRQETRGSVQVLSDSFSQPASAGARSTTMGPMSIREIVYRAEPYQIDLQVEVQAEHNRLVVTGQLLDVSHPDMVGLRVQIMLSNLRGSVLQVATNQFGEFCGELENSGDLELSISDRSGKPIVILLRGALKQSSVAK